MFKRYLKDYNSELVKFSNLMKDQGLDNQVICRWFNVNPCKFSMLKNNKANMTNNFKMILTLYINRVESIGVEKAVKEIKKLNKEFKFEKTI
jgi:hypothetical protein